MSITAEQRKARQGWIGASDVPAILGQSPWEDPAGIYYTKTADELPEEAPTAAQEQGNALEEVIIQLALPRITETEAVLSPETLGPIDIHGAPFAVNLDGLLAADDAVIEAKRRGDTEEWGDEGTDQVPTDVLIQTQVQLAVTSLVMGRPFEVAWVPVLLPGYATIEHRIYCVHRHDDLIAQILERAAKFWVDHVIPRRPPEGAVPPLEMLKSMRRVPASVVPWGDSEAALWAALDEAKAKRKSAAQDEEHLKRHVIDALRGAESATMPDGRLVTYLEQNSTPKVDHALMRAKWPEAAERCVTRGRHRVLRIKKG